MNERIKELVYEANPASKEIYESDSWQFNCAAWSAEDLKKFAELIVRECMSEIETVRGYKAGNAGPVYTQGFEDGMFVAIRTIEEHFGVEE